MTLQQISERKQRNFWRTMLRRKEREHEVTPRTVANGHRSAATPRPEISPDDPILEYFAGVSGVVDITDLDLDSPALAAMKAADVRLVVPLVSQGELVGLINLGPRMSQQEYSADDRKLLVDLAIQTAPAVRLAQLVRQQQEEAQEKERIEQELRVARLIQQTLLPREIPALSGHSLAAHYQPAREVGGDFYDFFELPDGRFGIVVGDVTDKGVPAALVMATTRSMLRSTALRPISPDAAPERGNNWQLRRGIGALKFSSPGEVLERVNEALVPDIPANMFVTCLYAVLDPKTGRLRYANAGHDLPYLRHENGASELRATGMPLGLMPGMGYEEKEIVLERGDSILFYSDGMVEAHDPRGQMFGFPRLQGLVGAHPGGAGLMRFLLEELDRFTGEGWEQEDDITMVTLQRTEGS